MVVPCFGPKVIFALCFGLTLVLSINLTKLSLLNFFAFCFSVHARRFLYSLPASYLIVSFKGFILVLGVNGNDSSVIAIHSFFL